MAEAPEIFNAEGADLAPAEMELEVDAAAPEAPQHGLSKSEENGAGKRGREGGEEGGDVDANGAGKKHKAEKSVEEERLEKPGEMDVGEEGKEVEGGGVDQKASSSVTLGPKVFGSSEEMFNYFYKFLHFWTPNIDVNKYEHSVILELLKKGHAEPDKKIAVGVRTFQVRNHPIWKSRCYFLMRTDGSYDDFSFRKCVDHILPLPENMKPSKGSKVFNGGHHRRGGGRRGRGGRGGFGRRG